ncbi:MAG: HD domain-containing protein [Bacilli bacterium]|nr:HD domain-containing protein [Bacilli bacterium]
MGLSKQEQERIYLAGLIHDIGKIGVPETILTKPGKLTPEEYKIIQSHSALSGDILSHVEELTSPKDSPSLGK